MQVNAVYLGILNEAISGISLRHKYCFEENTRKIQIFRTYMVLTSFIIFLSSIRPIETGYGCHKTELPL
jgi:hypothetical protein